jgi:signal transduction histidine kinase
LPETWQKGQGLGTRIMAHRASMIGATLALEPNPTGGTLVKCNFPMDPGVIRKHEGQFA